VETVPLNILCPGGTQSEVYGFRLQGRLAQPPGSQSPSFFLITVQGLSFESRAWQG